MRKLPQELAFPLGLGSKKSHTAPSERSSPTSPKNGHHNSANNTNSNKNKNNYSLGSKFSRNLSTASDNGDTDLRAPCQDLDTINL